MQIKGNTFIVTGGGSGLGLSAAQELLRLGANVVVIDLKNDGKSFFKGQEKNVLFVQADVTSEEEISKAIQQAVEKFGENIRGVVNCGGVFIVGKIIGSNGKPLDLNTFKFGINVNLVGTFNVCRLVAAQMVKQKPLEEGFDYQNIYLSMDLIKKFNNHHLNYIIIDFDRLHILNQPNDDILNISSIILKELGQILPLKLEYLDLSLSIDENIFEIFLKNSQNTFIKKLLINNKIQIGNENILSFIKEYIMKKKKIDYFAFKMKDDSDDSIEKCKDLFSMKDEVKIFESYNIKVQNYGDLKIQHYSYIEEMY
ncbi:unnamed protein product [Rhizophagus irregularis]|nr:unnamed protein product [Rhizophagus irregularis]